jgi:cell division protein FtsQ
MSSAESNSLQSAGRSWRDIRQEVTPLAMSRKGRSRRRLEWFKVGALCTLLAAGGWGIYSLAHSWKTDRTALTTAVHSEPVRDIALITDGVLTKKWAAEMLDLPKAATLMSLDLGTLRDKLLTDGQVRVAVLTRNFPDTLVVSLQERTPVVRLQASDGGGPARQLFVARDGVVYDGFNYDHKMVASLPWIAGVRLVKAASGHGFEPIAGMTDVSALLSMAQLEAPQLYRTWQIVSLDRLEARDEIVVKAQDVSEIIFTRKRDFRKQIAQLDYVVDRVRVFPDPTLLSVNLALEGQVPVTMRNTPDELTKLPTDSFSLQPSQQRKSKRDL